MEFYLDALKKYATFSGRATRQEFWMFALFHALIAIVLLIVDSILGTNRILYSIYMLGLFVPMIAISARRLHDTGRSGWWYLLNLVPLVGAIIVLVFYCSDSQRDNQYGPSPKY